MLYKGLDVMTNNQNKAIGVFDSGVGGLTAIRELQRVLPSENIIYFGDTGRVPYGMKSCDTILKYAKQDIAFLISQDVKFIIAACGTVSSLMENIYDINGIPFTGVVRPTALAAAKYSKNKKIGIIGTSATINSKSYAKSLLRIDPEITLYEQSCPLFAPMIESGFTKADDPVVKGAVERYISPLVELGMDTLILGCTHYPLISEAIRNVIGENVVLVDSGKEAAQYAKNLLNENNLLQTVNNKVTRNFYVSDSPKTFFELAKTFLGEFMPCKVQKIDIENY